MFDETANLGSPVRKYFLGSRLTNVSNLESLFISNIYFEDKIKI